MSEIKDTGARRQFGSGAVRDISEKKGRADLLPLKIIGEHFGWRPLTYIEDYIRHGMVQSLWSSLQWMAAENNMSRADAMLEVAKHYEAGAKKYGERNWEKGIPLHCYIDSAVRHYLKWQRGDQDEPHDRAFLWNILGAIWTHENKPEMIDLPFKGGKP